MTSDTLEVGGAKHYGRLKALAICVAMFAFYFALLKALGSLRAPLIPHLAPPPGAPALWWRVDLNVTLAGLTDVIAALVPVALYLKLRGRSFAGLGFNRPGTILAWVAVLAGQAGLVWFDTHLGPVGKAPGALGPYALLASAVVGPCAALAEEPFFRGYLMDELHRGRFSTTAQIAISGLFFGVAHVSYLTTPQGWSIPIFTGLLGMFWSGVYVMAKRSLWPTIVAHMINDAVLIPSIFYLIAAHFSR
ncbi:MAG: CPBP family intramembrane metalloprotease [Alphaproteobacteria bacterium]|nr:CPBP family intramembrane metalloprotease [Alphaproteobacteria bacterium]